MTVETGILLADLWWFSIWWPWCYHQCTQVLWNPPKLCVPSKRESHNMTVPVAMWPALSSNQCSPCWKVSNQPPDSCPPELTKEPQIWATVVLWFQQQPGELT